MLQNESAITQPTCTSSSPEQNATVCSDLLTNKAFSICRFDAETEKLFWQELNIKMVVTLKSALLLGAAAFLAFVILDASTKNLSPTELIGRLLIILALCGLFIHLHRHHQPHTQISRVVKSSVTISVINLLGILLIEGNPAFYIETWPGLLPIYFFTYGQMMLPIIDTILFGWLSTLMLPIAGYMIGVDVVTLIPSLLILAIVNLFGLCTRCQLEIHSRNSFRERRKAECTADDKALFLRQLSHNLRQPLQAISCYSSVLDSELIDVTSERLHSTASKLGSAIDELNEAFTHILDIANLETGKQLPIITKVDINKLLTALEDQFALQAAKRGLRLKIAYRTQVPYAVMSDASILRQILGNLLDNAIKYTASGWVLIKVIKIDDSHLKFHIRDTGIGISDEQKPKIFNEFYRGPRRWDDPHVHGLGLGLAYIIKSLEYLPDHKLDLHSKPSLGSDFQLSLPIAVDAPNCNCQDDNTGNNVSGSFVFIVDDDPEVQDALAEQVTSWGCLVQKASSKAEVLAALADNQRPPDLLITDFYLENDETAHDIVAVIEADCGSIPTLILSAHAIPAEEKARWPKTTQLLRKPASAAVLMGMMAKAMGK